MATLKKGSLHKRLKSAGFRLVKIKKHEIWEHSDGETVAIHTGSNVKRRVENSILQIIKKKERSNATK